MINTVYNGLKEYEQDVRELLMAFFPGETFSYEEKPGAEYTVTVSADSICIKKDPEGNAAESDVPELPAPEDAYKKNAAEDRADPANIYENAAANRVNSANTYDNAAAAYVLKERFTLTGVRKTDKSTIKRALYSLLNKLTGKELPYGTLTGIKPVKLVTGLMQTGQSREEIERELKSVYLISDEKMRLLLEIADIEEEIINRVDYKNGGSLYAGGPFCPTTCAYCSFTSYPIALWRDRVPDYINAVKKEAELLGKIMKAPLQTIYIGGGTPTSLSAEMLDRYISVIEESLDLSSVAEFTVEAGRPDSIDRDKLMVLKKHNVSRISINPQTMNDKTFKVIGRRHTAAEIIEKYYLARELGFDNINMDLIMGLPGENVDDVKYTLSKIEMLKPDSLTVHTLAVKRAARLNLSGKAWAGEELSEEERRAGGDEAAVMTGLGMQTARSLGMRPYYMYRQKNMTGNQENIGYAMPGKENLYNIFMMEERQTIAACGAGTSSKRLYPDGKGGRCENVKDVSIYIDNIEEMLNRKRKLFGS